MDRARSRMVVVVSVLALTLLGVGAAPSASAADPSPQTPPTFDGFADIPGGQWFTTPINWAATQDVTNSSNATFGATRSVNRAEFVSWLYRLAEPDMTGVPANRFRDVPADSWYTDAVRWAAHVGITRGVSADRFNPFGLTNRGEIITFLWRYAGQPTGPSFPANTFTDARSGEWFHQAVNWGVTTGVTSGAGGNRFEPRRTATRAEAITMLFRSDRIGLGIDSFHDDAVRMNEIQLMGTHNSYRFRTPAKLFDTLLSFRTLASGFGVDPYELDYANRPLAEQFGRLGARQIDLDVFADPEGGLYADRAFNTFPGVGLPLASGEAQLDAPGFKVLHIQDLDYSSHCLSFVACLTQVRNWSQANPTHLPIMILVEVKSDALPVPESFLSAVAKAPATPPQVDSALLSALDGEITSVFGPDEIITPDDVRGEAATLRDAVTNSGWPTLTEARGKVMFGLDNASGQVLNDYIAGRPNLEGRAMFADVGDPTAAGAAFFKRNTPSDPTIPGLIADGFMVRTRADGPYTSLLRDPGTGTYAGVATRRAALGSGASWVSSDYLEPTDSKMASLRGNLYTAFIPAGGVARCNPVRTSFACSDRLLLNDLFSPP